jgi:pyruvate kinase
VKLDADFTGMTFNRIDQSIAMGALFTAHHLGAKAIVALTDSGSTPLWMSRHRIHIPIYALTTKLATQRKMALFRNVRPWHSSRCASCWTMPPKTATAFRPSTSTIWSRSRP